MNVLISGTSSGIGKACAEKFLATGHRVYGVDIAEPTIDHPAYTHFVCDICSPDLPQVDDVEILVNNAGTLEDADSIAVNLEGSIAFTERYVQSPKLRSVVFIASASARTGSEFPRYVASKAGIVGYMRNLALALAPRGVTVNSVSPGGVVTPANQHILESEELYAAVLAESLLGKWASAEEVAEFAYFLTVTNRSMTGEDLLVDNGEMLKSNFIW